MRSIRWSLILYFMLLLGAALSGVAYFCYQSTEEALSAKEISTANLWERQFEDNRKRILDDFDKGLESRATKAAGNRALYHDRPEMLSVGLGMLSFQPHNGGPVVVLPLLAESMYPPNAVELYQRPKLPNILIEQPHTEQEGIPSASAVEDGQFYQTYYPTKDGPVPLEHSRTLSGFVWKLDKETRDNVDKLWPLGVLDDAKVAPNQTVRRVTKKLNINTSRRGLVVEPKINDKGPKWGPGPNAPPKAGEERNTMRGAKQPYIYFQFAESTALREKAIATLRAKLDKDLDELGGGLNETRQKLRATFLWIGLGTFAAMVLGGFWLVRLGLSPLSRLSDAVSRVSERDFRLPIDQHQLPSELKPIAGRFAVTLDQLKRAFEREKQAAADISHELRTPVAALLTTLEITLRKPRSADEYREVLEDCRNSGLQINKLVERLLTLARLDAGADQLRPREVDVAALADQCVALVRPLAEARGLQVNVHRNGPASMHADPDKLREVLTNLLHNAIEYNKPNGSIDVQVARTNGTMAMEVRDTGIGISPETRQRIFERFFRADSSRHADDSPHAGLGLAIVKGYVDLMGGSIDVDSTVGTGSTFRVRLPVL